MSLSKSANYLYWKLCLIRMCIAKYTFIHVSTLVYDALKKTILLWYQALKHIHKGSIKLPETMQVHDIKLVIAKATTGSKVVEFQLNQL